MTDKAESISEGVQAGDTIKYMADHGGSMVVSREGSVVKTIDCSKLTTLSPDQAHVLMKIVGQGVGLEFVPGKEFDDSPHGSFTETM